MEKLLISACLLGASCRYDGKSKPMPNLERLMERYELVPICPEIMGGLPTPRPPAERRGELVLTEKGDNVTAQYQKGAAEALYLAKLFGCKKALLKERSPSCGGREIYDGSFSRRLVPGMGTAAKLLFENGVAVFGESETEKLL